MVLSTGEIKDFSGVKSKGDELKFRLSSSNKIDSLVYSVYWPSRVLYVDRLI